MSKFAAKVTLVVHLVFVHVALFRTWYGSGSGLRNAFTRKENVHVHDLRLAIKIADGGVDLTAGAVGGATGQQPDISSGKKDKVAFLFMLRGRLDHSEVWKMWLASATGAHAGRVSLYFHFADSGDESKDQAMIKEEIVALRSLPGFRKVIPTVATAWCELMAAQVALLRAALLDDVDTELFVFLPHDSVPFAPLGVVLDTLMQPTPGGDGRRPRTRICPAGVRGLDVPYDCPHGIEPHWSRSLLLKHHQWMAVNRAHATQISDPIALRLAVDIFQKWFLGQPLCSDEVLPVLAMAAPPNLLQAFATARNTSLETPVPPLTVLPLYTAAAWGLAAHDAGLQSLDVAQECILYAPWPGCHVRTSSAGNKRSKSPVVGGGLSAQERDTLIRELGAQGVLFGRKLDLAGGSPESHMMAIASTGKGEGVLPAAPSRLMPERDVATPLAWVKWALTCIEAGVPLFVQVTVSTILAVATGHVAIRGGGISSEKWRSLFAVYVVIHFVIFFLSIVLCPEYSLTEPFKAVQGPQKAEI